VSSQAVALEQPAVATQERRPALAGAWLLSAGMLASGVLTYAFHVLAARSLGPAAYGQIAVLWAAMFIAAVMIFRPLEQTTSRALADRGARGEEVGSVLRSVALIGAVALGVVGLGAALFWAPLADALFGGDAMLTALLLAGVAAYGASYLVRGLLGGVRWFGGYGVCLLADALGRLAIAAPLIFVASRLTAAVAVAAAGLTGAVAPFLFGRAHLRGIAHGCPAAPFRVRRVLAFAAPATAIAAADQLLVNGGALLVTLGSGHGAGSTAGVVFAATMLVRAPVYVFQGFAASLLPNLTDLHARADRAEFRRAVVLTARVLLGTGAVIVLAAAAFGPEAMRTVYGPGFEAGRLELALLGVGVGVYLAASTCSQALLALDRARTAAVGWTSAAVIFVATYALVSGGPLVRISVAFAVAALADLAVLALLLARRLSVP
jgi:O-antigen/teichoic acid export membrane protein